MATQVTYPGVYVREESSGAQAVAAAATSTALFVGMSYKGPMDMPTRVLSQAEFERTFGSSSSGELMRPGPPILHQRRRRSLDHANRQRRPRRGDHASQRSGQCRRLRLVARDKGNAGNLLRAEVDYDTGSPERTFNLTLYRHELRPDGGYVQREIETFTDLSHGPGVALCAERRQRGQRARDGEVPTANRPGQAASRSAAGSTSGPPRPRRPRSAR